ncbi:MAG TPA: DUF2802 domain-containing protein [Povalibacter sp.]
MFEILPNPSMETLLVAGRALLLIGAFWVFALAFIRWRRADERNNERLQTQLQHTFTELRSLHETVSVMSARLDSMTKESEIDARLAPASSQRGYDVATRLARNGAGVEDLIENCGITRHEAELLVRLHGARAAESVPAQQRPQRPAHHDVQREAARSRQQQHPHQQQTQPPAVAGRKRGSLLSVVG